jgi:quercetin dioxygenase-like cupin family protein
MQTGIAVRAVFAALSVVAAPALAQTPTGARDSMTIAPSTATRGASMTITRAGSQPSQQGPAEWFTGTVRIDPLFSPPAPARAAGATVTFEPGARTAWHRHPLGQTLIVLSGLGLVQRDGGPIEEIRPGDVVWIAPGEKHWHGASPKTAMTHVAIHESLDGKVVEWLEHVTDDQYAAPPRVP